VLLAVMLAMTGLVLVAFPAVAVAQNDDAAAVEKVTKMNKKAVEEYENLNFEEARKILKDALDLCTQSGLDKHPITARTHVHLGVVILAGFKQRDLAIKQFLKALEIQPDIKLTKSLANPEIQEAFDDAVSQAGNKQPEIEHPPEPIPLTHEPVTRGTQGKAIPIQATVDPSLAAKRVTLSFKQDGAAEFTEREMTEASPGNWQSEIPASATAGGRVSYFIEVEGDKEETLATKGTEEAPLVVALKGAAPPPKEPAHDEDEGPHLYLALGLGSGIGWTSGNGEVNADHKVDPAGFALAGLGHVEPEIGYFIRPWLLLSALARFQYVTGPTEEKLPMTPAFANQCGGDYVCSTAKYALAGFAKLTWLMGDGNLHPFLNFALGAGYIRHVAEFKSAGLVCGPSGNQLCVDTVIAGPVLVGPGGGVAYNLSEGFALTLGASSYLGFPNFTFHVDVNGGIALEF
jgi:hypothetical protein